jgi:MSHA biogenesis protein MshL
VKPSDNTKHTLRFAGVLLGAALLTACSISPGWRDAVRGSMDKDLDEARTAGTGGKQLPGDVSQALLPPIEITLPDGGGAPIEPRFDLTVSNAPARQVLMGLVEGTPYSMVVHPDVRGTVSLNLKDVTVPEAINSIRHVYGYEYRREGNRFLVYGRDMQTRLFPVNYLNVNRKGRSDTRVVSGGGQAVAGATATAAGGSSGASNVQVETQSLSDFWKDLQTTLAAMVGAEGGRKVIVNPQVGVVIVRAMPEDLRLVEDFLGVTHANVNRQVVLEAKIIEVELNDRFQSGVNWAKIKNNYTIGQVGGGSTDLSTSGSTPAAGSLGTLRPGTGSFSATTPGTLSNAFGGVFTIAATAGDFTTFVDLLRAQGEVQVLSSPRISTVNNQKAVIKIGSDGFFATGGTAGTSSTANSSGSAGSVTLSSFFSGIALDVTPQIDEENNILLHIHPSVSNVTQQDKTFKGLGADGKDLQLPLALSAIQESDNMVRAQSGQIIVIGGLMKEGSTDEDSSVPLLGDIPILGNLFKHKKVTRIKKELVILLKPTVINTGQDWGDVTRESQDRIKKIRIGS